MSTLWTPRTKPGLPLKISCQRCGATMPGREPGGLTYLILAVGHIYVWACGCSIYFPFCQFSYFHFWVWLDSRWYNLHNIYKTSISAFVHSCSAPFYKIMVPTVDTVRYNFLVQALVLGQYPVLLTGPVGTGKTSVAQSALQGLDNNWTTLTVNMSSQVGAFAWPVYAGSVLLFLLP